MTTQHTRLWLPSAVTRISIFLFFFSLLVLSLFLLGNFQSFLDSTQTMLLHIFESSSLLYVVSVIFFVIMRAVLAVRGFERFRPLSVVLALLGACFLFAVYLGFGFLLTWIAPLN